MADREIQNAQDNINRLRRVLSQVGEIDNTDEIDTLVLKVSKTEQDIETLLDEKFELESEVRQLEAEVGPIKYIAELIYGETNPAIIDSAVRWLIIVFIFVFDPLAVILLIAANYSFANRHNKDNRQEEMFEGLFQKNKEKTLDNQEEISDNKEVNMNSDNDIEKDLEMDPQEHQLNELKTEFDEMMSIKEADEVVKHEIEKEQQQEIVKETKPEIKEPNELDDHGVKLDPAEVDLEKVIEKADEKTLNKLKKDIDREINTKKERKSGWLDDLGSGFYKD
jgi:type III secretory pathway component EscV